VATLQVAHELGLEFTEWVVIGAAEAASVPKLQWLHTEQGCPLPASIANYAAQCGSIGTLKWLQQHGSDFTARTCRTAAAGAHLHVLQFLRAEGCEWSPHACCEAAKNGHVSVLQWLHEEGCPWEAEYICTDAAVSGSIEIQHYLQQQGRVFDEIDSNKCSSTGALSCQYLIAEQCPCNDVACEMAAKNGHLETVRFLHESGCPWDPTTICCRAAVSGHVELMRYLKQQGCVLSEGAMCTAAARGFLRMCQYLRAEQCPWEKYACTTAAGGFHLDTLRWLHEQGCPWGVYDVRYAAATGGYVCVLAYVQDVAPAASAAQQTDLLNVAGVLGQLSVAKWLRQHDAEWPAVLTFRRHPWQYDVLLWAIDEGRTSPL
jgi:hypothetical protein